ncbi:hypothetical protein B0J18DRAFT_373998 [Chaetomium sp. MPI-SDFR-AT-0129]|nr:hypothetical protein B0J18DRAFT_373998 [Chaetomium sp. MPI-SDFR-AT-0129]
MLPFLEVDHLPSSSSFYSAVLQPLGLHYLSTEGGHFPFATFGNALGTPIFQIRQVASSRERPLKTSRIVFSAPSVAAAESCFEFARQSNPKSRAPHPRRSSESLASGVSARWLDTPGGGAVVVISDRVENVMEIVTSPASGYPQGFGGTTYPYAGSQIVEEPGKILKWNYGVTNSSTPTRSSAHRFHAHRYPGDDGGDNDDDDEDDENSPPVPKIRRSVTTRSAVYEPATSARENSHGLSAGAVAGSVLGTAAGTTGAAGTVALSSAVSYPKNYDSNREEYPQPYDNMPSFSRRSTFPERYDVYTSDHKRQYYGDDDRYVRDKSRSRGGDHYYTAASSDPYYQRAAPEYSSRHAPADAYQSSRSRASSVQPRGESASYRDPYATATYTTTSDLPDRRGYSSSRSSRHPPIVQRSYTFDTPDRDRDTYVSTRSHRSNSTVRTPGAAPLEISRDPYDYGQTSTPSYGGGGRVVTTTTTTYKVPRSYSRENSSNSYLSARQTPIATSISTPMYLSARDMPLTRSQTDMGAYASGRDGGYGASGGGAGYDAYDGYGDGYDDDDRSDAGSVEPDDSISCVGTRRSGRGY